MIVYLVRKKGKPESSSIDYKQLNEILSIIIADKMREQSDASISKIEFIKNDLLLKLKDDVHQMSQTVSKELSENTAKSKEEILNLKANIDKQIALVGNAQNEMKETQKDILGLTNILSGQKHRGTFGEFTLEGILTSVLGVNDKLWAKQYKLVKQHTKKDKDVAVYPDVVIFAKEPINILCIDSKFPLENYKRIHSGDDISVSEKEKFEKEFYKDVKLHIDAVSDKYIIKGQTAEFAIMYVPAEAVYSYIIGKAGDLIDYAAKKRVVIASPTTLTAIVSSIYMAIKNIEQTKQSKEIREKLLYLGGEFGRFVERYRTIESNFKTIDKSFSELTKTAIKISKAFDKIENIKEESEDDDIN